MKKALIAAAILGSVVSSAHAADMARPVYKAAPVIAPFSWNGFYIGGHAGWGWSKADNVTTLSTAPMDANAPGIDGDGAFGGLQLGYNWQVAPNWLFGIEADWSASGIKSDVVSSIPTSGGLPFINGAKSTSYDLDWLATLRARFGYTWDRSLIYVTGGFAWADASASSTIVSGVVTFNGSWSDTVSGWALGAGYEYAFANNWSVKLEYMYYDLGSFSGNVLPPVANPAFFSEKLDIHLQTVKFGVNYRF